MPLTPDDVRNKRFTSVRLREGYDMGEVDSFLDEVETELKKVASTDSDPEPAAAATRDTPAETPRSPEQGAAAADAQAPLAVHEASLAAARLMELAGRSADEVVAEAKQQAETIGAEARAEAARLEADSKATVASSESEARQRVEALDAETATRRSELLTDMERERESLTGEVEHLRAFEREYRSRLKLYFSSQLAQLEGEEAASDSLGDLQPEDVDADANGNSEPASEPQQPKSRLQSLLGDDPDGDQH